MQHPFFACRQSFGVPSSHILSRPCLRLYGNKAEAWLQSEFKKIISELEKEMKVAAQNLEFEKAALLRDQMYELRTIMAEESNAPPWKKIHILAGEDMRP